MGDLFEQSKADELGQWNNNQELSIKSNSSVTDDGLLESEDKDGDTTWRNDDKETFDSDVTEKKANI